jgi:sugar phosphate isomerase/epimerase
MALDIVRSHLCLVAFKDLARQRSLSITQQGAPSGGVVRMGQGFVDWPAVIATLKRLDFAGPVSFHSEYSGEPVESVIDLARIDVRFFTALCQKGEDHA